MTFYEMFCFKKACSITEIPWLTKWFYVRCFVSRMHWLSFRNIIACLCRGVTCVCFLSQRMWPQSHQTVHEGRVAAEVDDCKCHISWSNKRTIPLLVPGFCSVDVRSTSFMLCHGHLENCDTSHQCHSPTTISELCTSKHLYTCCPIKYPLVKNCNELS